MSIQDLQTFAKPVHNSLSLLKRIQRFHILSFLIEYGGVRLSCASLMNRVMINVAEALKACERKRRGGGDKPKVVTVDLFA